MIKQLSIVLFLAVLAVYAQDLDLTFCDPNKIPIDPKPVSQPKLNASSNFQMTVEINSEAFSQQVHEYYDGSKKVGVVHERIGNLSFTAYSYYDANQLVLVEGANCIVLKLNESTTEIPFGPVNGFIVPTILALPIQLSEAVYIGQKSVIRSIPVNEWQGCYYDSRDQTTNRITFSFSDPDQWLPVDYTDDEKSVLVQIFIESKNKSSDYVSSKTISVLSFSPFLEPKSADFMTPNGVFCEGRAIGKELPEMPNAFSFIIEDVVPAKNEHDSSGRIFYAKEQFDFNNKLFKVEDTDSIIVQDYSTGLSYLDSKINFTCAVFNQSILSLLSYGNNTSLRALLFNYDSTNYHYLGEKLQNGLLADVWVGNKTYQGRNAIFEWYFLSDKWKQQRQDATSPVPISIIVYRKDENTPSRQYVDSYFNLYDYEKGLLNLIDFDVSDCKKDLDKTYFLFSLSNSSIVALKKSLNMFKQAVVLELYKIARVVPFRISTPEVEFSKQSVFVTFAVYEKSKTYGYAKPPNDDVNLSEAIENLRGYFSNNQLKISYSDLWGEESYYSEMGSLKEIAYSNGAYVIDIQLIKQGFSAGSIVVAILTVTLLGICIGMLLVSLHSKKFIKLPIVDRMKSY